MLISLQNVSFSYGDNLIFSGVNLSFNEGERAGLIGANGEGKTTLLRVILGELAPDDGKVILKNGVRIGYLSQNGGYDSGNTVFAEMRQVFAGDFAATEKLERLSAELAVLDYKSHDYSVISSKIESLQKFISSRDSYNAEVKIKTVLNGMGFENCYTQTIDSMSGGEKTRLKLARLLLEEPDLLILDEPTNHLDISTLFWLEDYLQTYKGAMILVSHDRYFLDRLCTRIFELENKKLNTFTGNYSKYKVLKAELTARLQKEYDAQQEEIAKLKDYVARNIVRATTAKSAQSRVKQLERMELAEKPYFPPKPPAFSFTYAEKPYQNVLTVEDLNLEIGGKTLICGGQLNIVRGEKVALVGENGTGKTTFLKAVASNNRAITRGRYVKLALFDQEGLNLNPENTVLQELWERHAAATQTDVRALLARSGLFEEDMQKRVKSLSGGERAKLALAVLQSENANFLLLDEPTNHLDLPARESLEKALKNFDGTVLFVSHDRYFISAVATKIVEIENEKLNTYEGNYSSYAEQKSARAVAERRQKQSEEYAAKSQKRAESHRTRQDRAEEAKRKERTRRLEEQISLLEEEEASINSSLANPAALADYKQILQLTARLSQIKNLLDSLYSEYADMI